MIIPQVTTEYLRYREKCPICQSSARELLYRCKFEDSPIREYLLDFYGPQGKIEMEFLENGEFRVDECTTCGLIYQSYIPGEFLTKKLYEEWIDPQISFHRNRAKEKDYFLRLSGELQVIMGFFDHQPRELRLLDFGMGWGEWCLMARGFGCTVHGMEISPARMARAREMGIEVVTSENIEKQSYDFINAEQVFEHLADPLGTFQELTHYLKPGGIIKINVPNCYDIGRRLKIMDWQAPKGSRNSLNIIAPLEHINCFKEHSLKRMAAVFGYAPVSLKKELLLRRNLLDVNLREVLRPYHRVLSLWKEGHRYSSTYQFFARNS